MRWCDLFPGPKVCVKRGRVEIVHGRAAQHLSTAGEGLAAFLRCPRPVDALESPGADAVLTS